MPAGFNNGQIEYIKAVANVNGHKTYKPILFPSAKSSIATEHLTGLHDGALKYRVFTLSKAPLVYPTGPISATTDLITLPNVTDLSVFDIPPISDENAAIYQRQGAEGFLESTHLRFRCILDNPTTGDFTSEHNEYRMIVFRHKERQHSNAQHTQNHSNFWYDLFHGIGNYKVGLNGYRSVEDIQGNIDYVNNSLVGDYGYKWVDNQSAMTLPLNKEDYVIMKDHRFFLGKEYGGKNIFETTLHWDWRDPIATASTDVTESESNKNYTWFIMFLGNSNNTEGDASLNITIQGTTHMTSG